jgi:hypothetical protein
MDRFLEARRAPDLVVLEGFAALTNALRFADAILEVATGDPDAVATRLPPALAERFGAVVTHAGLPDDDILIVAKRPPFAPRPGPAIQLGRTTALDLGRAIRVAAAAGVATVYTDQDPWSEAALEAAQGLHFALAVGRPGGALPHDVALVFGAETEVATREGTTLDLPTRLAAALWRR